jgi:spermidine synthase
MVALPIIKLPGLYDFIEHTNKRGIITASLENRVEYSRWDPISKIDVLDTETYKKHIAYDGGSQSSHFFKFDGDYRKLRTELLTDTGRHVWNKGVLASHYLRKDSPKNVLIIGSAGGQETKVALAYGAAHVDAVEMVGTVVELGKERYTNFIGRIFNDPRVNTVIGEGRSYLRSTNTQYDIIQIYSNHTSSSIAAGTGAMATNYLQTTDAYKEYFNHLSDNGILHVNHHIYQRMIAVAAKAWNELGRENFIKHVLVY